MDNKNVNELIEILRKLKEDEVNAYTTDNMSEEDEALVNGMELAYSKSILAVKKYFS